MPRILEAGKTPSRREIWFENVWKDYREDGIIR